MLVEGIDRGIIIIENNGMNAKKVKHDAHFRFFYMQFSSSVQCK